jgi:phosphatidylinositol glycan class B
MRQRPHQEQPRPSPGAAVSGRLTGNETVLLIALCLVALLLRLRVGIDGNNLIHPDETFDYLEQGFRLAFGYGTQVWTYEDGVRSYVFPGLLAAVMKLGALFGPRPAAPLNAVAVFMSLLSLSIVVTAFLWGRRVAGTLGAAITGSIAAVWFELIYFAPHALSEVIATDFLVVATYLCPDWASAPASKWRWRWLGICLGLTFVFRIQLAPAILVIGLWLLARQGWRVALHVSVFAAIPVIATGMLDWATYSYPFQSFILNFWANTFGGVASHYGTEPFYYLIDLEIHYQTGLFALVILACVVAGMRLPLVLAIAASICVAHSLIGHKEYRFIYPALPFIFVLAGVATSQLVQAIGSQAPGSAQAGLAVLLIALWSFASWAQGMEGPFRREWLRSSGMLAAARFIAARPDVCGIGYYNSPDAPAGMVHLNHNVPMIGDTTPEQFERDFRSFNVVIAADDKLPPGDAFTLDRCWENGFNEASYNRRMPHVCVLTRPAQCEPGAVGQPDPNRPRGW